MSLRDAFLKPPQVPIEAVEVPSLGVTVHLHGMTVAERSAFESQFRKSNGQPNKTRQKQTRERLVIATACDESGQKLFTDADVDLLGQQPANVLEPLVDAAQRVCGMSEEDTENLEGN